MTEIPRLPGEEATPPIAQWHDIDPDTLETYQAAVARANHANFRTDLFAIEVAEQPGGVQDGPLRVRLRGAWQIDRRGDAGDFFTELRAVQAEPELIHEPLPPLLAPSVPEEAEEIPRSTLGEYLRAHRLAQGRSMDDVGKQHDLKKGYLSQVESGRVWRSGVGQVIRLASAYGVPMEAILRDVYGVDLFTSEMPTGSQAAARIGQQVLNLPPAGQVFVREIIADIAAGERSADE